MGQRQVVGETLEAKSLHPAFFDMLLHLNVEPVRLGQRTRVMYHQKIGTSVVCVASFFEQVTVLDLVTCTELWLVANEDVLPQVNRNRIGCI